MQETIQQQVVSEYLNKNVTHEEALKVIENDFGGIVVYLGLRRTMQIQTQNKAFVNYNDAEKRKVITLFNQCKSLEEICFIVKLSKKLVKEILHDYLGKKVTAASKN